MTNNLYKSHKFLYLEVIIIIEPKIYANVYHIRPKSDDEKNL